MTSQNSRSQYKPSISQETRQQIAEVQKNGTISVCFFNNKGGVGKTTLVANLASTLAIYFGFKILVVDADPQCNLTQYVLDDEFFLDRYSTPDIAESIYSVIHPLSIGRGYREDLPIFKSDAFGFDLIIGDPRLALKEDLLAQDWRDAKAGGTRGLRTTFVFSDLISKASNYDLIFFDMGPSLGAINRAILLAVDNFIVPMSIDIFSLWGIRNIGNAVSLWQKELEAGIRMAEDPTELPKARDSQGIRFLGYVTQQHKERRELGRRRIVEAYNEINQNIPNEIEANLKNLYASRKMDPHLGDIKHLASLAPKSQSLHTPMIQVSLTGSYTVTRKQAREMFVQIAKRFIENTAH